MAVDSQDIINDLGNRYEKEAHFRAEVQEWMEANRERGMAVGTDPWHKGFAQGFSTAMTELDNIVEMLGFEELG